jgi:uncharacterized membrane protein
VVTGSAERPPRERRFERGGEEFGRVLAFSDGMFAIAMTLLVVGITVPALSEHNSVDELADALNGLSDSIVSFFISFAVIGRYWIAHHQMFSLLRAFDPGLIGLNLVYLAFIAFLPFPTAILGTYFDNPLAVSLYAVSVAVISGMEEVLLRHAHRGGLLTKAMPENVYRWGRNGSLTPVAIFLASVPVAFVSSELAVAVWLLANPAGIAVTRRAPDEVDAYFS